MQLVTTVSASVVFTPHCLCSTLISWSVVSIYGVDRRRMESGRHSSLHPLLLLMLNEPASVSIGQLIEADDRVIVERISERVHQLLEWRRRLLFHFQLERLEVGEVRPGSGVLLHFHWTRLQRVGRFVSNGTRRDQWNTLQAGPGNTQRL